MAFRDGLRSARVGRGLRLSDLAEKVGCTPAALSHLETGRTKPTHTQFILRVCRELDRLDLFHEAVREVGVVTLKTGEYPFLGADLAIGWDRIDNRLASRIYAALNSG